MSLLLKFHRKSRIKSALSKDWIDPAIRTPTRKASLLSSRDHKPSSARVASPTMPSALRPC